jgi:hypothetical protein
MFSGAGIALGRPGGAALAAFGIVSLGVFVAGPFGTELTDLVGVGGGFGAVVAVFAAIVAGAALLPSLATSIIGVALLAATLTADVVVADGCGGGAPTVVPSLVGFVAVWWLAGRWARRA